MARYTALADKPYQVMAVAGAAAVMPLRVEAEEVE
jgi:hypothetical protein